MNPDRAATTARIRAARAFAGLSQPELAEAIGMSLPTYKRAELGNRPVPTAELLRIARACEVPPWFLTADWASEPTASRKIGHGDVPSRLDVIEERLSLIELTARQLFEVLEAFTLRRGIPLEASADDDPIRIMSQ